mgnify:CR=1 FL=1
MQALIDEVVSATTPEDSSLRSMCDYHMGTGGKRLRALLPLLVDDTRRASSRAGLALLRRIGPRTMFKMAPSKHKQAYDMGALDTTVRRGDAVLRFRGAALFAHPTWRVLQNMAQQTLMALADVPAEVEGVDEGNDGFSVRVRW